MREEQRSLERASHCKGRNCSRAVELATEEVIQSGKSRKRGLAQVKLQKCLYKFKIY